MQEQYLAVIKQIIEDNIDNESFSVADLAREGGLSRSMLHRKLIRLTGKSATELITEIRLTKAYELLENDAGTVSEIAYRVGYSSPSYFNKVFKKTYNVSPGDVRRNGSGKISHLRVIKEPGNSGSAKSRRSILKVIAGANILLIIIVIVGVVALILRLMEKVSPFSILPEWTITLILIILIVGFIIAVVLSWVYNIHPVEDTDKTESVPKSRSDYFTRSSKIWKTVSYISFVVIVGLIVLNNIPREGKKEILDKSVAVLPFINDSQDQENEHFINGIMEDLVINLQSIKELRVPGRTSTEQYRNTTKLIPEIANEMNVAYIVEGRGQRYGDRIRLRVQLVECATDKHIWADSFDEVINGPEDIFRIQSQIAESIAAELEAVITPEQKQRIERVPTNNLTAFDFYQRGREEAWNHLANWDLERLDVAEDLFRKALQYDKNFAQAYSGLAKVYLYRWQWDKIRNQDHLDSAHYFLDKALIYDSQLAEAYAIRGALFSMSGEKEKAFAAFDNALELNPNEWQAYHGKYVYSMMHDDIVGALKNIYMVAQLNHDIFYPAILRSLGWLYRATGFLDRAESCSRDAFLLDSDSLIHSRSIVSHSESIGDYSSAIECLMERLENDKGDTALIADIVSFYGFSGEYEQALKWCMEYFHDPELIKGLTLEHSMYRIGLIFWESGYKEIANVFFARQIESSTAIIESESFSNYDSNNPYYNLASVYAFKGENDQAYENLTLFLTDWENEYIPLYIVTRIKNDPFFDNIRDEPEFQQIFRDAESKYQAGHEEIRQWLEENDLL
ncbi:MAG: helix-turn-helix domain-containing protein [Bacteroidota bacterium]